MKLNYEGQLSKEKYRDENSQLVFSTSHSFSELVVEEERVTLAPFESLDEIFVELYEGVFLDNLVVYDTVVIFDKLQGHSKGFPIVNDEDGNDYNFYNDHLDKIE